MDVGERLEKRGEADAGKGGGVLGRRDGGTAGRRDGGTAGRRDGGTAGRRDGGTRISTIKISQLENHLSNTCRFSKAPLARSRHI
jgi:hypothetical protein